MWFSGTLKAVFLCGACFYIGCADRGSASPDDSGTEEEDTGSETDTTSDTGTGSDTGTDTDIDAAVPCDAGCEEGVWNECTCDPSDPCGWAEDGMCAGQCIELGIVAEMFDDSVDCPGECTGLCDRGVYVSCTCGSGDPCQWIEDGHCDDACLSAGVVVDMFDDSIDCGDAGTT